MPDEKDTIIDMSGTPKDPGHSMDLTEFLKELAAMSPAEVAEEDLPDGPELLALMMVRRTADVLDRQVEKRRSQGVKTEELVTPELNVRYLQYLRSRELFDFFWDPAFDLGSSA